jgi:hypothetical protein
VKVARKVATGARDAQAWAAVADGAWAGPLRVDADGSAYAGRLSLVDADDDRRRAGVRAQARRIGGWGGVTVTADAQIAGAPRSRSVALVGEASLSGDATADAAEAVLDAIEARMLRAVRDLDGSPADDPAWRRRLAARAVLAVGVGVAAGLAGAAWDRRRRE